MNLSDSALLEISELSSRAQTLARGSAKDRQEADILTQRIGTIRQTGLSSDEVRAKYGQALTNSLSVNEAEYRSAFTRYITAPKEQCEKELRDVLAGSQSISYTKGVEGGYTVPIHMEQEIFEALAQTDGLLSEDACNFTVVPTPILQPRTISGYDLSTISASQIGEATQQTPGSFPTVAGKVLRSNLIYKLTFGVTLEAEDDIPNLLAKVSRAMGVGFARKLGADAVNGNGTTQPQGIANAVPSTGITLGFDSPGGGIPGVISQEELNALYFSVNRIYRAQPKCGFLMSDSVYQRVREARDTADRPLICVEDDSETLFGKPIWICPSLSEVGGSPASYGQIIFGDLDHFHIRCSKPTIQRVTQSSIADITKGEAALIARVRMDSALFDPSNGSAPPLVSASVHP